jgi:hypothetical protein
MESLRSYISFSFLPLATIIRSNLPLLQASSPANRNTVLPIRLVKHELGVSAVYTGEKTAQVVITFDGSLTSVVIRSCVNTVMARR